MNQDPQKEWWGHRRSVVSELDFRIGMVNVGGLPVDDTSNTKMKEIHLYVSKLNVDVIGLSECNVSWRNLPVQDRLQERTRGWWESIQINSAYYETFGS